MAHRGFPEHGPWWRLGRDLLCLLVLAGVFTALFILFSLALHGTVNW
jgi:hypothetical protein